MKNHTAETFDRLLKQIATRNLDAKGFRLEINSQHIPNDQVTWAQMKQTHEARDQFDIWRPVHVNFDLTDRRFVYQLPNQELADVLVGCLAEKISNDTL